MGPREFLPGRRQCHRSSCRHAGGSDTQAAEFGPGSRTVSGG